MARGADLFVICKSCGSEVSPYVTECPYCGARVRKRAPKIERDAGGELGGVDDPRGPIAELPELDPPAAGGRPRDLGGGRRAKRPGKAKAKPERRANRPQRAPRRRPSVPRVDVGNLRADRLGRPIVTISVIAVSYLAYLVSVAGAYSPLDAVLLGAPWDEPWRLLTAVLLPIESGGVAVFAGGAYAFATLLCVGIFGTLLERRHGPWVLLVLVLVLAAAPMAAAAAVDPNVIAAGANGLALGLLACWAVPDLQRWRRDQEWEGDLLATGTLAALLLVLPLGVTAADPVVGLAGGLLGLLAGHPLVRRAI